MIIDACLYAGEREMLDLRIRTLADVVDEFVVVMCDRTHQNDPAPWDEWCADLERWLTTRRTLQYNAITPRLRCWDVEGLPRVSVYVCEPSQERHGNNGRTVIRPEGERGPAGNPWFQHIEKQHRNAVRDAVAYFAHPSGDEIVMVSDVDEIPTPEFVQSLDSLLTDRAKPWVCAEQRMHSGALDLLHPYQPWTGTMAARYRDLEPQRMRNARADDRDRIIFVPKAGWHFSWFGTDEDRQRKLETFSHAELRGKFDPAEGRRTLRHSNGEPLEVLHADRWRDLSWPTPIVDRSFTPPDHWWHQR